MQGGGSDKMMDSGMALGSEDRKIFDLLAPAKARSS
jgi:hypothetical protein